MINAKSQFKNVLESARWTNLKPLEPNNPRDTQSQLAKNYMHPLTS